MAEIFNDVAEIFKFCYRIFFAGVDVCFNPLNGHQSLSKSASLTDLNKKTSKMKSTKTTFETMQNNGGESFSAGPNKCTTNVGWLVGKNNRLNYNAKGIIYIRLKIKYLVSCRGVI